jgi:hypothetical protein
MSTQTDLSKQAIEQADADNLPEEHELRRLAASFNQAATGFYSEPQTVTVKQFLGAWARFRKVWEAYSTGSK